MSAALRPSCVWLAVSSSAMGRPWASTKAWILVVRPPRERLMQPGPLFIAIGAMLVNPDRRAIDHLHVNVVSC